MKNQQVQVAHPEMNVLITGGRGGLGRCLAETLGSEGAGVNVVTLGRSAPATFSEGDTLRHEVGDVTDAGDLDELLARHGITHVVHAAGARTRDCHADPRLAFESNVLGTSRMVEAASRHPGMVKIIHLSTAAVYGRRWECLNESAQVAAGSAYAITKAASELVLAPEPGWSRSFATVILRPGFVLAPAGQGSLASLIREAIRSERVTGTLPDRFPLHWAPDLARIVVQLLKSDTGPHLVLHPLCCNTGADEFAQCLKETVGRRGVSPRIDIQVDSQAPFPAGLVDNACRELVGRITLTPLAEMVEAMLPACSPAAIEP